MKVYIRNWPSGELLDTIDESDEGAIRAAVAIDPVSRVVCVDTPDGNIIVSSAGGNLTGMRIAGTY